MDRNRFALANTARHRHSGRAATIYSGDFFNRHDIELLAPFVEDSISATEVASVHTADDITTIVSTRGHAYTMPADRLIVWWRAPQHEPRELPHSRPPFSHR